MKELYTKPVSEVNEFSQTADVITTSGEGTDWGFCLLYTSDAADE